MGAKKRVSFILGGWVGLAFCPSLRDVTVAASVGWWSSTTHFLLVANYLTMIVILQDSCASKLFHPISLVWCFKPANKKPKQVPEMIDPTNEWIPGCGLLVRLLCKKRNTINSVYIYKYTLRPQLDDFKTEDAIVWSHRVFAKTCQNYNHLVSHTFWWMSSCGQDVRVNTYCFEGCCPLVRR